MAGGAKPNDKNVGPPPQQHRKTSTGVLTGLIDEMETRRDSPKHQPNLALVAPSPAPSVFGSGWAGTGIGDVDQGLVGHVRHRPRDATLGRLNSGGEVMARDASLSSAAAAAAEPSAGMNVVRRNQRQPGGKP